MARQQRKMMAMQVAMTRERLPWFVGIASFFTLGALGGLVRGKLEPVIAAPLVIVWTITGMFCICLFCFKYFYFFFLSENQ